VKPKLIFYFVFLFSFTLEVKAQQDSALKAYYKYRKLYVHDLSHKINVSGLIVGAGNGFELRSKQNIRLRPNETGNIGLRFTHQWLTIGLSLRIKNLNPERRGTTNFLNIVANSYGKKWGGDAYYLSYKGHYITNSYVADLPQFLDSNTYPILPNLNTVYSGINGYYIFNHQKYSYRASFIRNEIQRKSAGSFLMMMSYSYFKLSSDTGFIPSSVIQNFLPESRINSGKFNSVSIMPGYAHTFVFAKNYFFTLSPSIGLMTQFQNYTINGLTVKGVQKGGSVIYPRGMARAALGYNSKKWYCGISAIVDNYIIQLPENDLLIYNIGNANIYAGFRIDVPKKLKRLSKKIDEYSPQHIIDEIIK